MVIIIVSWRYTQPVCTIIWVMLFFRWCLWTCYFDHWHFEMPNSTHKQPPPFSRCRCVKCFSDLSHRGRYLALTDVLPQHHPRTSNVPVQTLLTIDTIAFEIHLKMILSILVLYCWNFSTPLKSTLFHFEFNILPTLFSVPLQMQKLASKFHTSK